MRREILNILVWVVIVPPRSSGTIVMDDMGARSAFEGDCYLGTGDGSAPILRHALTLKNCTG